MTPAERDRLLTQEMEQRFENLKMAFQVWQMAHVCYKDPSPEKWDKMCRELEKFELAVLDLERELGYNGTGADVEISTTHLGSKPWRSVTCMRS